MLKEEFKSLKPACRNGMTLIEVLIASSISLLVIAGVISATTTIARSQRKGFYQQRIYEQADRLEDVIQKNLRDASREAGVFFTDAVPNTNNAFYYGIIFRTGLNKPNQKLSFNPATSILTYDPDIAVANNEIKLGMDKAITGDGRLKTDYVWFRAGLKGNIPDSSAFFVELRVSDHGLGRNVPDTTSNKAKFFTAQRSFSVNARLA